MKSYARARRERMTPEEHERDKARRSEWEDRRRERLGLPPVQRRGSFDPSSTTNQVTLKRNMLKAKKSVPCMDCGGRFPIQVMDLDHTRGEKLFTLSDAVFNRARSSGREKSFKFVVTLEEFQRELDKCDAVCSNCHRIRTYANSSSGLIYWHEPS